MATRPYAIKPDLPLIQMPIATVVGSEVYPTEWMRIWQERVTQSLVFEDKDLIKETADAVDSLSTDYYTTAESDARYYQQTYIDATFATLAGTYSRSYIDANYYTQGQANTLLSGKANTSHTHAASDVTSGTFANARISASSVTQHQAALTITESQISDLGSYATTQTGAYTAAETAHTEPADFAAVKTALDTLGTRINELQAKLVAAGIGA